MSLASDLLEQAFHLSRMDIKKPRQASLRRAISTAYYALFHLLVEAAASTFAPTVPLQPLFARALDHGDAKKVCEWFLGSSAGKGWEKHIVSVPDELKNVARTFIDMQEARHNADYNLDERFDRTKVVEMLNSVKQAFEDWHAMKAHPISLVFLSALLLGKQSRLR